MRGSAIVFATVAIGVSALLERAGVSGTTFGAGGFAQAPAGGQQQQDDTS